MSDPTVREQLSSLKALVALGQLMTEAGDEDRIVALATSAVPSLGPWRVVGVQLEGTGWKADGEVLAEAGRAAVESQLDALAGAAGPIDLGERGSGQAFPVHSFGGAIGHLLVLSEDPERTETRYLLATLAQQLGIAVTNVRSRADARSSVATLRGTNEELSATLSRLERRNVIHERLMLVEILGEGEPGIATALHELTGLPVAIEDQHGNLRAWAGPDRPEPYPKTQQDRRQRLLRRARDEGRAVRDGDRLLSVTRANSDSVGVIAVLDPDRSLREGDLIALDHSITVLAVELARLRELEDTQLQLGLGLFDALLAGHDEEDALARAHAMGYDLERPHRVAVVRWDGTPDELLRTTRRVAAEAGLEPLVGLRLGEVSILAPDGAAWGEVSSKLGDVVEPMRCRLGLGGLSHRPREVPRSFREAIFALDVGEVLRSDPAMVAFDGLGLLRVLAHVDDVRRMRQLMVDELGPLLEYDARRGGQLVLTLATFLDHGGAYRPTSEDLHIHRSTLKYRLGRIREIAGVDLSDPRTAFDLQVATRIWATLSSTVHEAGPGS